MSAPRSADLVLTHLERMAAREQGRIVPPETGRVVRADRPRP